jgi:hypothetical protein
MYFGPSISVGRRGVSYGDSDAQAFIAATGLTGTTEVNAVNNLVANLKSYGLWSKMKAIYPFVSDTVNLLSYSEDFTNAYWGKYNLSTTANQTTAPDGTLTADKIIVNNGVSGGSSFYPATTVTATASAQFSTSVYLKSAQFTDCIIWLDGKNGGAFVSRIVANVDMNAGTISLGTIGSGWTNVSCSITNAGNGWYRASLTGNIPSTCNGVVPEIVLNQTGNGVNGIFAWGYQCESGTTTTYQPIATTPANRFVSQFKYNLKDARDLDAAFRLAFNGTWTYSKQGATPNGVNAYADSFLNQLTSLSANNLHLSYYSRTSTATSNSIELGVNNNSGASYNPQYSITVRNSTGNSTSSVMGDYNTNFAKVTSLTTSACYIIGSRTTSTVNKLYQNGSLIATDSTTNSTSANNYSFYIAASNGGGGGALQYSPKQTAFATIGNGLTDTEATNLYTSVQLFQQELSRYVGVPIVSDANAQAFLDAAVITDQTQANAVNTLVTDLKTYGLWTKMKAIYPFVGGTATTHKWNLKDPRDLDAAYRLAFSGAWTHSSTGALPNGANAYADTFLTPSGALSQNNTHISSYIRNTSTGVLMGCDSTYRLWITPNFNGSQKYVEINTTTTSPGTPISSATGLWLGNRLASNLSKLFNNTTLNYSHATASAGLETSKVFISARNTGVASNYSSSQTAFSSIGDGLTDTEATDLSTAVNKFQTSLSRNV